MKKKLLSALMGANLLVTSLGFAGITVKAAPAEAWKNVYIMEAAPADAKQIVYFDGNLSGTNDEVYKITFTANHYQTGVDGWRFYVADGDSNAEMFFKDAMTVAEDDARGSFDREYAFAETSAAANPYTATAEMVVDFSTATPTANITFYDKNMVSFGNKTVTLDGIDSLQKIYVDMWSVGNLAYSTPKNTSLKIEKQVTGTWKNAYTMTSESNNNHGNESDENRYYDYFDGNLSGANGETYKITFAANHYQTGVHGWHFKVADGDSEQELFYKDVMTVAEGDARGSFDRKYAFAETSAAANPYTATVEMVVDFSTATPTADITFYDRNRVPFGNKKVTLDGIDSVQKIYVRMWSTGNLAYSAPKNVSFKIDEFVVGDWQDVYTMENETYSDNNYNCDYFDGNLSGANGEIYKIIYEAKSFQTGCPGWTFKLGDADTTVELFFKDVKDGRGAFDRTYAFTDTANPFKFIAEILIDFGAATPTADITFYDENKVAFGSKSVILDGIDSLQKISARVWDANADTLYYARPKDPSLRIGRFGQAENTIELAGATKMDSFVSVDLTIQNSEADSLPYALIAGYFKGNQLIWCDQETGSVAAGDTKNGHVFMIPEEIKGKFDKVTVYLWNGMDGLVPYTGAVDAQ